MDCGRFEHHVYLPPGEGQWWEVAVSPDGQMVWQQMIKGQEWASSTDAVHDQLQRMGLCTKPNGLAPGEPYATLQPTEATAIAPMTTPNTMTAGEGGMGLMLVLGLAGSALWAWFNRDKGDFEDDYHPMADVPGLPPVYVAAWRNPQGNQTLEVPSVFGSEFARNSREFAGNSNSEERNQAESEGNTLIYPDSSPLFDGNSPEFAGNQDAPSTEFRTFPPKDMGAPYDPLEPEQEGEFDSYRRALDKDGFSPKGNDIIKALWGCTPGRSAAYLAARKRRDDFAKRLNYYRYEEL